MTRIKVLFAALLYCTHADLTCGNDFTFTLKVYNEDLFHTVEALSEEMKSGAVHIGSCQTKMTLNSENKYSAEFDSIKWSDCGIHPQQSGQELYFEAEVTPDPPTVTAHNGILITKSLTKSYTIKCSYPTTIILDASIEVNEGGVEAGVDHATGNINEIFQLGIFTDVDYTIAVGDSGINLGDHVYATLTSTVVPSEIDWYIKYCKVASDSDSTVSVTLFEDYYCINNIFRTTLEMTDAAYRFSFMSFWFTNFSTGHQHLICEVHLCTESSCSPILPSTCPSGYSNMEAI